MVKMDVKNLDKEDPVRSMFLQLLMIAKMKSGDKKIVSDMFTKLESGNRLSAGQVSLVTSIYLKYHDPSDKTKVKTSSASISDDNRPAMPAKDMGGWNKLLK